MPHTGVPSLPGYISRALEALESAGYETYLVGGCVRDYLSGKEPHDYDMTTSALPEEVKAVFSDYRIIETGIKHGTVTLLTGGGPVEITTFRTDGSYSDSRHPDSVSFTRNITEDLARRDFTVNAVAYSPSRGFADPFGGAADLEAGLIRAVGQPEKRFGEDALRIMRGLRFSAVCGYRIEAETALAMEKCAPLLDNVSGERVFTELKKLLCGDFCGNTLRKYGGVLARVLPCLENMRGFEQNHPYHVHDVLEHTIIVVENVPAEPVLRLAALLHDAGKPDVMTEDANGVRHFPGHAARSVALAERFFERMRSDSRTRDEVTELIKYHDSKIPPEKKALRRWLGRLGETRLRRLFALKRADVLAQNPAEPYILRLEELRYELSLLDEVIADGDCVRIKDLAIGGQDIIALGCPEGPEVGRALSRLLDAVTGGRVKNERDSLLAEASVLLGDGGGRAVPDEKP